MKAKEIVQQDNKVLRKVAEQVLVKDISSTKIQKIITEMKESLLSQYDGVAIAAPQIGYSVRIFIVSGRIFDERFKRGAGIPANEPANKPDMVFINPEFMKMSKKKKLLPEGCLSVRWLYGDVKRSTNATVTAYDEHGKKFTKVGSGLLAQIFQHETDHLDGILFIDKAENVEEHVPETK
jgi:peptide deformylase